MRTDDLAAASHGRAALRGAAASNARSAVFTARDPGHDIAAFATEQDADLVVLDGNEWAVETSGFSTSVRGVLAEATADVAIVYGALGAGARTIAVPFGGAIHDWAAAEIAALLATARSGSMRLIGLDVGRQDASRIIAWVALALQRRVGIDPEPVLAAPGVNGLLNAAKGCDAIVFGLSDRLCVMKNGKTVGTYQTADVNEDQVLGMIIAGKRPEGKTEAPRATA